MTTAAVIGSGFGGLALAIRLQSAGIQTTLVEARDKPGGRAYVFEDDGFIFDAGPTVITDPPCLKELWALSGHDISEYVELMPVMPFYRLNWPDGVNGADGRDGTGAKRKCRRRRLSIVVGCSRDGGRVDWSVSHLWRYRGADMDIIRRYKPMDDVWYKHLL